ncbi:MAG: macro domain-containing protein, partial [Candidatus Obscuribacterales bacterium]|nr:macro domain-containing protein [Candidatus Obscuribacterales bacterium]
RATDSESKREAIFAQVKSFVRKHFYDKLFPLDPATGRRKEPSYTNPEGKSLLLDFAGDNLMQLLVAHSTPLWYVQTHKLGSASQPIAFVGLNGTKIPDNVVDMLKKQIPTFRPTDIVLSDSEARILVKQYDPLYSLASMVSITDYENYYKNTDRKFNPMHTDVKFANEPNPYLQWLSYKSPQDEAAEEEAAARVAVDKAERERAALERLAAGREAVDKANAQREEAEQATAEVVARLKTSQQLKVSQQVKAPHSEPAPVHEEAHKAAAATTATAIATAKMPDEFLADVEAKEVLSRLSLSLRDFNPDVVKAWQSFFSRLGEEAKVEMSEGDILELTCPVMIVPVNSFGIMASGLALALNKKMDGDFETMVRKMIQDKYAGELPIGTAEVIETGKESPRIVVVAPTVRVPSNIMAVNVNPYLSTRASLLALAKYIGGLPKAEQGKILSFSMSGLGTGGGRSSPATAAFQMYEAYCQVVLGKLPNFATIEAATAHDQELKKNRFV